MMFQTCIKITILLFLSICLPVQAAKNQLTSNSLIGTWKLISMTHENLVTGIVADDYGPNPVGYLSYSPDGHMIVIITKANRKKLTNKITASHEAIELLNTMTSYAGTYTIKDKQIVHHIDVAWNPSWVNTNQVRFYKLEGNRLTLTMPPYTDPLLGKIKVRLVWKKLS